MKQMLITLWRDRTLVMTTCGPASRYGSCS